MPLWGDETAFTWSVWLELAWGVAMHSRLKRGFPYFKVSPIKAFLEINHVSVRKVLATDGLRLKEIPRI